MSYLYTVKRLIVILLLITCGAILAQQKVDKVEIYTITEEVPEYPGGSSAMMKFFMENLSLSSKGSKAGCVTLHLKFIVYEDGSLHDVAFLIPTEEREGLNTEVQRVIRLMPRWKPGKMNGKVVKCYYSLPLRLLLE